MDSLFRYKDKYFSILGDSISTLEGVSEPCDAVFYAGAKKFETNVFEISDTWWGQVVEHLGGKILVNNSYSGSMVIKHRLCEIESYGCSDLRTGSLSIGDITPDVVMVFLGINDFGCAAKPFPGSGEESNISVFSVAYSKMLEKIKVNYPDAEIWCLTLPVSKCERNPRFFFPYRMSGYHIEEYNKGIKIAVQNHGCKLIDLYLEDKPHDTLEGFHPTGEGMKTLSKNIIEIIRKW